MKNFNGILEKLRIIEKEAKDLVAERIEEFRNLGLFGSELELFSELSFCVLTANWSASGGIMVQKEIGPVGFAELTPEELSNALSLKGHRFPNKRAEFIVENRRLIGTLRNVLSLPVTEARKTLIKEAKGIGWKEASHFLRNTGQLDVAILDRHILKVLFNEGLIERIPKGWTEERYISIEDVFKRLSEIFGKQPGETDLYLWYLVKGRVEK
jgi:N-glycosylase/DNA lyase